MLRRVLIVSKEGAARYGRDFSVPRDRSGLPEVPRDPAKTSSARFIKIQFSYQNVIDDEAD